MQLVIRLVTFFVLEIYLTFIGLDDIADYIEFTDERKQIVLGVQVTQNLITTT